MSELFLSTLEKTAPSDARQFIDAYHDLIAQGLNRGFSSVRIFYAFQALGLPPPMSQRQFRRYVSAIKQEVLSGALQTKTPAVGEATRTVMPVLSHPGCHERSNLIENAAVGHSSERPTRPSVLTPKTFNWNPTADFDDLS
ncbi:hypothetical protein CCR95_22620 [Thiocystis minor]|nr:hypothetical protein [Thiocystis minor]